MSEPKTEWPKVRIPVSMEMKAYNYAVEAADQVLTALGVSDLAVTHADVIQLLRALGCLRLAGSLLQAGCDIGLPVVLPVGDMNFLAEP